MLPLAAAKIPYHASGTPGAWQCNAGYFRTPSATAPTCARCSGPLTCEAGWYAAECANGMDSVCVQCPLLTGVAAFAVNLQCAVARCLPGYYLSAQGKCVACPRGSFCADGLAASPCGGNCTTSGPGAGTALMCVASPQHQHTATITYLLRDAPQRAVRLAWPPYVTTRSCSLSALEFTCIVSMPKCVADAVFQWW